MANRWAVANGNWSNTATWNGGTLPTSADDVFSNNFTVTIDGTFTVLSISNASATGINAGGSFTFANGGDLTCTAGDGVKAANVTVLNFNLPSGQSATLRGNVIRSTGANTTAMTCTNTGTFNIVGNLLLSAATGTFRILDISIAASGGTINHIGDIINSNAANNLITGGGNSFLYTYNHTGNAYGGSANSSTAGAAISSAGTFGGTTLTYNCTGNHFAGTSPTLYLSGAIITIVGNVTGTSDRMAINLIAGSPLPPSTVNVSGIITAGVNQPAIVGLVTTLVSVQGTIINQGTYNAIYAGRITLEGNVAYWQYRNALNNTSINLYTVGALNYPVITNVRSGVVYGSSSEFTGTANIPSAANVRKGVPVDATVGTADLTAADFWDYLASNITTAGSIGEVVKNTKTNTDRIPNNPTSNESVGAIVASYNV